MATFPAAVSAAANDARVDRFDVGTGNPTISIWTAGYAVKLLEFTLDGTAAFGASTVACPSVATATGLPISTTGLADGTAAVYRAFDRDGTTVSEGSSVTATGGGGEVQVSSLSITTSQPFELTAFTIAQPCS